MKKICIILGLFWGSLVAGPTEELIDAVFRGNVAAVSSALDRGAEANLLVVCQDSEGNIHSKDTLLMIAVKEGNKEIVEALLDKGAEPNVQRPDAKTTALMSAASGDIAQLLINHGASVNVQDSEGSTPLMHAVDLGDESLEVACVLIENGANVDAQDERGRTSLMEAVTHCHARMVTLLIDSGADTDVQDTEGSTALLDAARLRRNARVFYVVGQQMGPGEFDDCGQTSKEKFYDEIIYRLIKSGAHIPESLRRHPHIKAALAFSFFSTIVESRKLLIPDGSSERAVRAAAREMVSRGYDTHKFDEVYYATPSQCMVRDKIRLWRTQGYSLVELRAYNNRNLLHSAVFHLSASSDVAKFLVYYYPALILAPDSQGQSPLQHAFAARNGMPELLLDGLAQWRGRVAKRRLEEGGSPDAQRPRLGAHDEQGAR